MEERRVREGGGEEEMWERKRKRRRGEIEREREREVRDGKQEKQGREKKRGVW